MALLIFLSNTIIISLTGVMAPGAVTTATIAQGMKNKWAGFLISIGHGIIEIPLIFALMYGLDSIFKGQVFKIWLGFVGGGFLCWLAIGMIRESRHVHIQRPRTVNTGSIATGFMLSITNPYFLFWWATVGLKLADEAGKLGKTALVLFALVHWLCDLVWLTILSFASSKGTDILGLKNQVRILRGCGIAMFVFGVIFIFKSVKMIVFQ